MPKKILSVATISQTQNKQKNLSITIASGVSLLSLLLGTHSAFADVPQVEDSTSMSQVTNVNQLSDVQPTDWAFQALQSLVERYGCIAGYPNGTFRGNRAMTRYEFAAGLNACLDRVNELIATATTDLVKKEDLATLQRLQENFSGELTAIRGRVDNLEAYTAELEANQFSTTTKLQGQAIISVTSGGFSGRGITDATGRQITNNPNATVVYRAGLDLNTSFSGTDLLKLRLEQGSGFDENGQPVGGKDNAAGLLEPYFGSALDYSINPPTHDTLELSRLYYTFRATPDLNVTLGPAIRAADFLDYNSYAKLSFLDFSTEAFENNYILFPLNFPSAGAIVDWKPGGGAISVRGAYAALDPSNPGNTGPIVGTQRFLEVLYPGNFLPPNLGPNVGGNPPPSNGDRGIFGDTYQGTVELEYAPSRALAVRLQYAGGEVFNKRFDVIGANIELTLAGKFGIFGRYGYGSYTDTAFGDIKPNYWMAGIAMRDLFTRGALAGVAVGQPFIANQIGNSTQTNYEAFYNYPFSRNIQVTPTIQLIDHAGNQGSNGTIITGTLRTVFSF